MKHTIDYTGVDYHERIKINYTGSRKLSERTR